MTRTQYLNLAIERTQQALIMRRNQLYKTANVTKAMAREALKQARAA